MPEPVSVHSCLQALPDLLAPFVIPTPGSSSASFCKVNSCYNDTGYSNTALWSEFCAQTRAGDCQDCFATTTSRHKGQNDGNACSLDVNWLLYALVNCWYACTANRALCNVCRFAGPVSCWWGCNHPSRGQIFSQHPLEGCCGASGHLLHCCAHYASGLLCFSSSSTSSDYKLVANKQFSYQWFSTSSLPKILNAVIVRVTISVTLLQLAIEMFFLPSSVSGPAQYV